MAKLESLSATAAIRAAIDAGVKHFIWSTRPDVEAISGDKFNVPHFTGKAKIDRVVKSIWAGESFPRQLNATDGALH